MKFVVVETEEFSDWLSNQRKKSQSQIDKRVTRIRLDGHFGSTNILEDGVFELKWKNWRRV